MKEKLANFWYYHKWHLLVAVFLVAVIVVCAVQTCRHTGHDYTLMYAGPKTLATPDVSQLCATVSDIAAKAEGAEKTTELHHYYVNLSPGNTSGGVTHQNLENFDNEILAGQAIILLISPTLYDRVMESNGGLLPLDAYIPADTDPAAFYDDTHYALKLSALDLYTAPGFSSLPEDTLLCLRTSVSVTGLFQKKKSEEAHLAYQRLFYALVDRKTEPQTADQ